MDASRRGARALAMRSEATLAQATRMVLLSIVCASCRAAGASAPSTITWASHPIQPGEILLLQVSPVSNSTAFVFTSAAHGDSAQHRAAPLFTTDIGAAVIVPPQLPRDVSLYVAAATGAEGAPGEPFPLNTAELSWIHGSEGNFTRPGGWLRVFGRSLAFVPLGSIGLPRPQLEASATTLRLTPVGVGGQDPASHTITATWQNLSAFHAHFTIPHHVQAGEYEVELANDGQNYVKLDSFISEFEPHIKTVVIRPMQPPARVFVLESESSRPHGINQTDAQGRLIDSSQDIKWGLAQAAQLGPGPKVLQLEAGWYAVQGQLSIPDGVTLAGAGVGKTMLMWQYQNVTTAPANGQITSAAGATTWGVRDLTITVNTFFVSVFNVTSEIVGWKLQRVVVRANPFFCASTTGAPVPVTHAHEVPWSVDGLQHADGSRLRAVLVHMAGRNWQITDCDLYSAWGVLSGNMAGRDAGFGWMARNKVYNGHGATFNADGASQWIVEQNEITGVSVMAGGNSFATGTTPVLHHNFFSRNHFKFDWGQDREIMTFDGGGMGYAGPVAAISADGTNFTSSRLCRPTHTFEGGSFTVLNGTGAGQLRRLVSWGYTAGHSACWFQIEAPFAVPVTAGSSQWISAQIFKGASIFEGNFYEDTGAFQLYGMAMDMIVHAEKGSRMTGFHNWGQWHRRNDTGDSHWPDHEIWHNQPHPNMRTQWLHNTLLDGQGSPHAGVPMVPSNAVGSVQFSNYAFTIAGAQRGGDGLLFPIPMNRLTVYRGNRIEGTYGGFSLGANYWSSELVLDGNTMDGLALTNQSVSKAGVWTGPIGYSAGSSPSIALRNNSVNGKLLPNFP